MSSSVSCSRKLIETEEKFAETLIYTWSVRSTVAAIWGLQLPSKGGVGESSLGDSILTMWDLTISPETVLELNWVRENPADVC